MKISKLGNTVVYNFSIFAKWILYLPKTKRPQQTQEPISYYEHDISKTIYKKTFMFAMCLLKHYNIIKVSMHIFKLV